MDNFPLVTFYKVTRSWTVILCLGLLLIASNVSKASVDDPLILKLQVGAQVRLPELPTDPQQLESFEKLTLAEQRSFYFKRKFVFERLVAGIGKPGLKSGIRWVKRKVYALKDGILGKTDSGLLQEQTILDWQNLPENLSEDTKREIEVAITSLSENFWANATDIAKNNGIGFTFVGGGIFNVTTPVAGYIRGRSLSVDIGVDFANQTGYMRVLRDDQRKKMNGISFDIGLMFDVLVHVTDPTFEEGSEFEATHVKLPIIGCFRQGPSYKAWGFQMGYHVVEMVGTWLLAFGRPDLGAALIAGTRGIGAATIYSTTLNRKVLKLKNVNEPTLRKYGLGRALDLARELHQSESQDCDSTFNDQ